MRRNGPTPGARGGGRALPEAVRRQVIRETLETLTRTERVALALFHYEKIGPTGIADALNVSRRTVDRLLAAGNDQVSAALRRREGRLDETDRRAAA